MFNLGATRPAPNTIDAYRRDLYGALGVTRWPSTSPATTVEKNETFNVVMSAASGATISDASGTATLVNDD
ncbi:MAG: hypothetical protein LC708_02125 [Actinobacteria bacterium]|nr:hypothetical protein [Actinomycetota bacterium]